MSTCDRLSVVNSSHTGNMAASGAGLFIAAGSTNTSVTTSSFLVRAAALQTDQSGSNAHP